MFNKISKLSSVLMLAGILLGFLFGYFLPGFSLAIDFLGIIFLGALKVLIIPMIVAVLIVGVNAFGDARKAGRTGLNVLGYFAGTTVAAVIVGLVSSLFFSPEPLTQVLRTTYPITPGWHSVSQALGSLMPGNLVQAIADGKYLGVVLLAVFLGGVLTTMKTSGRSVVSLFKAIHDALLKLVNLLLVIAPIGLFSLVAGAVAQNRALLTDSIPSVLTYLAMALVALGIHFLVVQPLFLWIFSRRSPLEFYSHLTPAFLTALGTSSSLAAFPVTYNCVSEEAKVDNRASSMVLPLGSVVNLDGTAIVLVVISIFSLKLFGIPLGFENVALVAVLSVVLSIGAAGIPSATLIAAPALFIAIGLPPQQAVAASSILLVSDWLVDRIRALVNMTGDAVGCAVIAESFELKTARKAPASRRAPADRRPSRTGRGRTAPTRERQPGRHNDRIGDRRTERTSVDDRNRGPRTSRPTDAPAGERAPQRSGRPQGPSPFEMKASTTPSLETEAGSGVRSRPSGPPSRNDRPDRPDRNERTERTDRTEAAPRRGRPQRDAAATRSRSAGTGEPPRQTSHTRPPARTEARPVDRRQAPVPEVPESKPIQKPEPAAEAHAIENEVGHLSPTVVARELARVSAQLNVPKDDSNTPESGDQRDQIEPVAPPVAKAPVVRARPVASRTETEPDAEPARTLIQPPDMDEVEETEEAVHSVAKETEPEPQPEVTFGRARRQRGAALKTDRGKVAKPADEAGEKPEKPKETEKTEKLETKVMAEHIEKPVTEDKPKADEKPVETEESAPEAPAKPAPSPDKPADKDTEEGGSFGRVKRKRVRR